MGSRTNRNFVSIAPLTFLSSGRGTTTRQARAADARRGDRGRGTRKHHHTRIAMHLDSFTMSHPLTSCLSCTSRFTWADGSSPHLIDESHRPRTIAGTERMRRSGGLNISSSASRLADDPRGRSKSPGGLRNWRNAEHEGSRNGSGHFLSPSMPAREQDAAILQSVSGDDVKIRQGKALLKPSEIRNRTPGKKRQKDWGECPLTFDKIKEPVRAMDGNVYERWAIKKWLEENGNRSPLTNVVIDPTLTPLQDSDEGTVKGSRFVSSPPKDKDGVKTEINTVLNTVR